MFRATLVLRGMDRRRLGAPFADWCFVLLLGALSAWNESLYRLFASIGRPLPSVYEACRYELEPPPAEEWLDVLELLRRGVGDCEDLACAEVGRLRAQGIDARPGFHRRTITEDDGSTRVIYHIFVAYPGGYLDDPSRALGMLRTNAPE